jgi:hypothetical protein
MILRDQCRVVYGSSSSLQQLSQALTRDERHFALPIWIENSAVAKAANDLAAAKLEKTKQAEAERLAAEEKARMESIRQRRRNRSRLLLRPNFKHPMDRPQRRD